MKKKKVIVLIIYNLVNVLFILFSLFLVSMALFMRGFGPFMPLWVKLLGAFVLLWILAQYHINKILARLTEGKISRNQIVSYAKKAIVIVTIVFIPVIFWHKRSYQEYMQWIFKEFFTETDVQQVKLIRGSFFKWMDWHGSLTFKADPDTFKKIVKNYKIISKDKFGGHYFEDEIMNNPNIIVYHREIKLSDEVYDNCYLAWNEKKQTAYFQVHNAFYRK